MARYRALGLGHQRRMRSPVADIPCAAIIVVDGDSLRCGAERLRLLGIDAPEMGKCPSWRVCVAGDGEASKQSLKSATAYGPVRYRIVGHDRYGRALVLAWAGSTNLGCHQVRSGKADYIVKWDNGRQLAKVCGW